MKILHIITHFSITSGAAKLVSTLIPCQIRLGNQVDVLALYDLHPTYEQEIKKLGCNYNYLWNKEKDRFNPKTVHKLIPIIKNYDIVHTHLFPSLYWGVIAKKISNTKCKLVVTEHSTLNNRQGKVWMKPIERYIYKRYDAIISISDAVKIYLHKYVDSHLNIDTIVNGINLDSFHNAKPISRMNLGIPDDIVLVTHVAGFRPPKDQKTVLKAIKRLPNNIHAMFVGTGETLQEHIELAKNMGVLDRVHFVGLREDVPALLKASDIVVMSSHFEGFGLAAVEGMAAGKPVIGSNVPGLKEVIQGAGILFPKHDDETLSNEILKLSTDKSYKNNIINRCKSRAEEFDIKIMAQKYNNIYERIINKN